MEYKPTENKHNANAIGNRDYTILDRLYRAAKVGLVSALVLATASGCIMTTSKYKKAEKQLNNIEQVLSKEPANEKEAKQQEKLVDRLAETQYKLETGKADWNKLPPEEKAQYKETNSVVIELENFSRYLENEQGGKENGNTTNN